MKVLKLMAILAAFAMIATTSCKNKDDDETTKTYQVTFAVMTADEVALDGAEITMGTTTIETDEEGKATFDVEDGIHPYTVTLAGYDTNTNSVTVNGKDESVVVTMVPAKAVVTFEVTDGTDPIEGATITINGEDKTTDADGEAVFYLGEGSHSYAVNAEGYNEETDNVAIAFGEMAITVSVTMTISATPLSTPVGFTWVKEGASESLYDPVGLKLKSGSYEPRSPYAVIIKNTASKMVLLSTNAADFDKITTKQELQAAVDAGTDEADIKEVSVNATADYTIVIGTKTGDDYYLVKISKATVTSGDAGTKVSIETTWQE